MKYWNKVITLNSDTGEFGEKFFETRPDRAEFDLSFLKKEDGSLKLPGEFNLDSRIHLARKEATKFETKGYYIENLSGTRDFVHYWRFQKDICRYGLLIDGDFLIIGDLYFYLNFCPIPLKDKASEGFPYILDLDYWTYLCDEYSELTDDNMVILKARQTGYSLKYCSKLLKGVWLEKKFISKIIVGDESQVEKDFLEILSVYRNHLNTHTGWKRNFDPDTTLYWKQRTKNVDGTYSGLQSSIQGITTKASVTKGVGGAANQILLEEAGTNKNVEKILLYTNNNLRQGKFVTGFVKILGAVGELKDAEGLKNVFYNPKIWGCMAFSNVWDGKPKEFVGLFCSTAYGFLGYVDENGNSDVAGATIEIERMAEEEKQKGFSSYQLYKSQNPLNPSEAFLERETNIFPIDIIQEQIEFLERNYTPTGVTLSKKQDGNWIHKFGEKFPIITEYPIRSNSDKRGCIVIEEPPVSNPQFGLYYASVDPIKLIKTSTSDSLMAIYIYKASNTINGEYANDKMVAWYCGRHDNAEDTYKICLSLIEYYNARTAVENDVRTFTEWMIREKRTKYLMRRSEMPILTEWVPNSKINEQFGWITGSGMGDNSVKYHLFSLFIEYCTEIIDWRFDLETGEGKPIKGVSRIKDIMLLKEALKWTKTANTDRLIAFCGVLMAARSNTNRGVMVREPAIYKPLKPMNSLLTTQLYNGYTEFNSLR